jgi:hypothetical protein
MAADFWDDSRKAEATLKEIKSVKVWTEPTRKCCMTSTAKAT